MDNLNGYENEYEFVKYLNRRKIFELNPMFRELIDKLFPYEDEKSEIKCWRNHLPQKSDIFIKINDTMKGISIKKGIKNSIHVERITDFIHFLIENGVNREIIIDYLKFQYADGSTNGKGGKRVSTEEYKKYNQVSIDKINLAFNDEKLLKKAIDRFVTKGKNSNYYISAIIYGEVDNFIWITTKDIKKIILSKKYNYSTGLHFGSLLCQPKSRNLNYNPKHENGRYCVQIKWYSLFDDIIENMNDKIINHDV